MISFFTCGLLIIQDGIIIAVDFMVPIGTDHMKASRSVSAQSDRRQCETEKEKTSSIVVFDTAVDIGY
jgi:hypothetical protein